MPTVNSELIRLHVENGLFSQQNAEAYINGCTQTAKEKLLRYLPMIFTKGEERRLGHPGCKGRYIVQK